MAKIAVIGSGISGLSCAYELQKAGHSVTVFEKESFVGGRMSTLTRGQMYFDRGANFLLKGYPTIRHYVKELELSSQWRVEKPGMSAVLYKGKLHSIHLQSAKDVLQFSAFSLWSRIRLLKLLFTIHHLMPKFDFFQLMDIPQKYNTIDAYSYIAKEATPEVADYLTDPFNRTMNFHSTKYVSKAAVLGLLSMMGRGDDTFHMCYLNNGMSILTEALAATVTLHKNTPVLKVQTRDTNVSVTTKKRIYSFDYVVMACPPPVSVEIAQSLTAEQKKALSCVEYAQTINTSFTLPASILNGYKCVYIPYKENRMISEFTNEYMKDVGDTESTLVNIGMHEEAAIKYLNLSDSEVYAAIEKEFQKIIPGAELTPFAIHRWQYAMPKFSVEHIRSMNILWELQGENRLYFAGDYMNAPWTEGAARCGQRVARMIIEQF